jgi:transposase
MRPPDARDRIEMGLLSAAGWSPPRIAAHLGCHAKTVRQLLDRFPRDGLGCLVRQPPGPHPTRRVAA